MLTYSVTGDIVVKVSRDWSTITWYNGRVKLRFFYPSTKN